MRWFLGVNILCLLFGVLVPVLWGRGLDTLVLSATMIALGISGLAVWQKDKGGT